MSAGWTQEHATGVTDVKTRTRVSALESFLSCRLQGVRHTTDGGLTWSWMNAGLTVGTHDCIEVYNLPQGLFVTTMHGPFKWNGSSWVRSNGFSTADGNTHYVSPWLINRNGELIVLYFNGQWACYVSTDGGSSFVLRASAYPTVTGIAGCTFCDSQGRLWFSSEGSGAARSLDGGRTWQSVNAPSGKANGARFYETPNGTILGFIKAAIIRWDEATKQWLPSNDSVFYYLDTLWRALNVGSAIYASSSHAKNLLYRSLDDGLTWHAYNETPPPAASTLAAARGYSPAFDDGGHIEVALRGGEIWKTNDPVPEWTSAPPPPPPPPPPPAFSVIVEGTVTFNGGNGPTIDWATWQYTGTQQELIDYVNQHYHHD